MGVAGHIGLAFDPLDEMQAVNALMGGGDGDASWLKYQTEFPLDDENWWEMHHIFLHLAGIKAELAPLATVILGTHSIGEGPGTDFFLHGAEDMEAKAKAFALVDQAKFFDAANAALDHPDHIDWYGRPEIRAKRPEICAHLHSDFQKISEEVTKVSLGGWAFIGFMA